MLEPLGIVNCENWPSWPFIRLLRYSNRFFCMSFSSSSLNIKDIFKALLSWWEELRIAGTNLLSTHLVRTYPPSLNDLGRVATEDVKHLLFCLRRSVARVNALSVYPVRRVEEPLVWGINLDILPAREAPAARHQVQATALKLRLLWSIGFVLSSFLYFRFSTVHGCLRGLLKFLPLEAAVNTIGWRLRHIVSWWQLIIAASLSDINFRDSVRWLKGIQWGGRFHIEVRQIVVSIRHYLLNRLRISLRVWNRSVATLGRGFNSTLRAELVGEFRLRWYLWSLLKMAHILINLF